MVFTPGQQVGTYRLVNKLGSGGYGEVWLAERATAVATMQVALKLPFDPDIDLIRREAATWLRASGHPNIVPVWDADIDASGQVYIASEYIQGGQLTQWLLDQGGKAPSLSVAVDMMSDILKGLEHLHALQPEPLIHRDLKPDNILLQGGIPRLTDFGLTRAMRSSSTQNITGTPPYMAPEVFSGEYSTASDIWSAGVIFYWLCTGTLPFPQHDIPALLGAILTGRPNPLPDDTPSNVIAVFDTVFQKDPGKRYPSAHAMRDCIEALLHSSSAPSSATASLITPKDINLDVNSKNVSLDVNSRDRTSNSVDPNSGATSTGSPVADPGASPNRAIDLAPLFQTILKGQIPPLPQDTPGELRKIIDRVLPNTGNTEDKKRAQTPETVREIVQGFRFQVAQSTPHVANFTNSLGMEFVYIPNGEFMMGDEERPDNPTHIVYLDTYSISKYPVTVHQYFEFVRAAGHREPVAPAWGWQEDHPIVNVNWEDAMAFCRWLSYLTGNRIILPTEAQWEKAARGTDGRKYPWGNDWDATCFQGSHRQLGDAGGTVAVTHHTAGASPYGVVDMAGNVWEWCLDWHDQIRPHGSPRRNPMGPAEVRSCRVLRGGGWWNYFPDDFTVSYRSYGFPDRFNYGTGFRVVSLTVI